MAIRSLEIWVALAASGSVVVLKTPVGPLATVGVIVTVSVTVPAKLFRL